MRKLIALLAALALALSGTACESSDEDCSSLGSQHASAGGTDGAELAAKSKSKKIKSDDDDC